MEEKKCKRCGQILTESNYFEIPEINEKSRKKIVPRKVELFGIGPNCNDCCWMKYHSPM
jgi:hypothetical protein